MVYLKYIKMSKLFKFTWAISFSFLLSSISIAQDAWTKVKLEGEITYYSFSTTKQFDEDGEIIRRTQSESNGSTHQVLTFYPGRFQLMTKDPVKLKEFNEANTHHIFFGETYDTEKAEPLLSQVKFSTEYKAWEKCNQSNELILTTTSSGNGESMVTAAKSHLSMIETRSPMDIEAEEAFLEGLQKFGQDVLDKKKEQDIANGKTINESDYFMPANLYDDKNFGLYVFTNWWTVKDFQNPPLINKNRYYNCDTKSWEESISETEIQISDDNRVLLDDYEDGKNKGHFRYINIPASQMEKFINDPTVPTVFIGGSRKFFKEQNEENEITEIITLTVRKAD